MLTELTAEQKAQMQPWAEKWIAIGLSTERADWKTFDKAVVDCYKFASLDEPKAIVHCQSPVVALIAGPIAALILENLNKLESEIKRTRNKNLVDTIVKDIVPKSIVNALNSYKVGDPCKLETRQGESTSNSMHDAILNSVRETLVRVIFLHEKDNLKKDKVSSVLKKKVKKFKSKLQSSMSQAIKDNWSKYIGGQFWASWVAYTTFFEEVVGLELEGDLWERNRAYANTMMSACIWWPHKLFVIVSDRPTQIHIEQVAPSGWNSHCLHSETGAAISWPDSWGIWSWHGVRVPRHIIEAPDEITLDEIKSEKNAEVRRIMIDRYGRGKYMLNTDMKVIDMDYEGAEQGSAPRMLVEDGDGQRILVGTDGGTGRVYYMPVEGSIEKCKDAHESLCAFDETKIVTKS